MKSVQIHDIAHRPTIFHVTQHKCASQWVGEILKWSAYRRCVLPEQCSNHVKNYPLIQGLVYPTVYLQQEELQSVLRNNPHIIDHKIFVVTRDMRDVLVSYYFSVMKSHPAGFENVERRRTEIEKWISKML